MKSIQYKAILFMAVAAVSLSGCTEDSDVEYPVAPKTLFAEDFNNADLTATGWKLEAEIGDNNWIQEVHNDDGYATFSSFGSGDAVNVAWLISPALNMDTQNGEKLFFQNTHDGFLRNPENTLDLYVSTDYDGVNFEAAGWERIPFNVITQNDVRFVYKNSGIIDLSGYTGTLHFAFKVRGTSSLTGGFQVDKVRVFY